MIDRRLFLAGGSALASAAVSSRWLPAIAQTDRTLRVVQPWEFATVNPADSGISYLRASVTETLVASDNDGKVVPALAQSWESNEAATRWELKVRPGVTFHDGSPVTPAAVKASIETMLPRALYLKSAKITAIETTTNSVVFNLAQSFGPFLAYLTDHSMPILAPTAFSADGAVVKLVATGPFKLESVELPRRMNLRRHEGYWGEKAHFERGTFEAVTNGETRANIAIAGDASLVMNIPTPSVARVSSSDAMKVDRIIVPRVNNVMFNCAKPQFADVKVRQALNMAIDRVAIATAIMRNPSVAATQYLPPGLPDWYFADFPAYVADVPRANAILDERGWTKGPDGTRQKDGVRFAGTIRTFANRPELPAIATAMQAMLRSVGFDMTISVGDYAAIYDGQRDGTLELALSSRNLVFVPDPISTLASDFAQENPAAGGQGATNWTSDSLKRDIAAYFRATTEKDRQPLRKSIARVLHDEVPVMPIVWYDQIFTVASDLDGFGNDPFEKTLFLNRLKARK